MLKAEQQKFLKEAWHYYIHGTREERDDSKQRKCRKQIIQVTDEDKSFRREKTWGDEVTCNSMFGNSRQ